ncbi:MAG: M15 family metallopeptidase [Saprospirales bacterium]|nr:M15 family metallopeptidase [Saprospirales bacterium]
MKQMIFGLLGLAFLACGAASEKQQEGKMLTSMQSDFPTVDYIMGKFDPAKHPDFTVIPTIYADREGLYLRKDVFEAYKQLHAAAKADGVNLAIISAPRPFNYQKGIWEAKWNGSRLVEGKDLSRAIPDPRARALKILEYSSMPGTSRHHWGTDFDLNELEDAYFQSGAGKKVYEWLTAHASEYGFCQVYTAKGPDRPEGYNEEKWHWTYVPVAKQLTDFAQANLTDDMISGFQGAEAAKAIGVVGKYVLGINPDCR